MVLKFGFPPISASKGLMKDWTNCLTRLLNCAPITTATARSTRFPRRTKFLKPLMRPGFPRYRGLSASAAAGPGPGRAARRDQGLRPERARAWLTAVSPGRGSRTAAAGPRRRREPDTKRELTMA